VRDTFVILGEENALANLAPPGHIGGGVLALHGSRQAKDQVLEDLANHVGKRR
jgi:hypothetical protein